MGTRWKFHGTVHAVARRIKITRKFVESFRGRVKSRAVKFPVNSTTRGACSPRRAEKTHNSREFKFGEAPSRKILVLRYFCKYSNSTDQWRSRDITHYASCCPAMMLQMSTRYHFSCSRRVLVFQSRIQRLTAPSYRKLTGIDTATRVDTIRSHAC